MNTPVARKGEVSKVAELWGLSCNIPEHLAERGCVSVWPQMSQRNQPSTLFEGPFLMC